MGLCTCKLVDIRDLLIAFDHRRGDAPGLGHKDLVGLEVIVRGLLELAYKFLEEGVGHSLRVFCIRAH